MAVLLLLVLSGGLLAYGWINEDPTWVKVALGTSLLAAGLVLLSRFGPLPMRRFLAGEPEEGSATGSPEVPESDTSDEPEQIEPEQIEPEPDAEPELAPDPAPAADPVPLADATGEEDTRVVFVPGRLTFHSPECSMVKEKAISSALRADLEGGGMNPCRRCLKS